MAVLVDPPRWPAHGRMWSHLVSDTSLAELHAVAGRAGVPRRGFSGDHYDVPAEMLDDVVAAGAHPVPARELLARLQASGLRVPKRRGETVLGSWAVRAASGAGADPAGAVDLLASPLAVPDDAAAGGWLVVQDGRGRLLLSGAGPRGDGPAGLRLPGGQVAPGEGAAVAALRGLAAAGGPDLDPADLAACGYLRVRPGAGGAARTTGWRWSPYFTARLPGPADRFAGDLAWVAPEQLPSPEVPRDEPPGDGPPAAPQPWPLVLHVLGAAAGRRP